MPEIVASLGLAPEEVAALHGLVERCNEAALARLQAEYDALKRPAASFSDVSGRFRASFGRKKTGCLFRHPVFSFRPRDYFFSVRVMRFSLMRAFLPVRSRR